MNIIEALTRAQKQLAKANISLYNLEASLLLAHVLNKDRSYIYLNRDRELRDFEVDEYFHLIRRREEGEPIHYILEKREFMGLDFFVDKNVLIPRPDTEILVEHTLEKFKDRSKEVLNILEIGTGSGAIAVSLAYFLEEAYILATDIEDKALDMARRNAKRHGLENRINFCLADIFDIKEGPKNFIEGKKYDILVSNPPYIASPDIEGLDRGVRDFEPLRALDGGPDGLCFYRKLIRGAGDYLKAGGLFAVEVGYDQAHKVRKLLEQSNKFEDINFARDLQGYDRVVSARLKEEF